MCIVVVTIATALPPLARADADPSNGGNNSNTPIKVGYAVITPTSTATAGLVVFETFGERQGKNFLAVGVLPSIMTTRAALFANANGRLSRNLGVAIVNPSTLPANITLELRNEDGAILATVPFVLDAHLQTARFVTEFFENQSSVPEDFTGTLVISSDIPIAVVGLRSRGSNFSTMPATIFGPVAPVPLIDTNVGGPAAVILAQFASGGGWATEIVIANFGPDPLTVRVDLFTPDGSPLSTTLNNQTGSSFQGIIVPAGGAVTLAPRDDAGNSDF